MPVVPSTVPILSPPTNAYGLVQYLAQRIPGFDYSEYLRELNSAYIHVWEEVSKLKNNYFTKIKTVTVAKAQQVFDLLYNADGGLSSPLSNRLYQVSRIRVQPPAGGLLQATSSMSFTDPNFIAVAASASTTPTQTGPYYWVPFGRGNIQWAMPLAVGTGLEIVYTFWPLPLIYQLGGTVSSSGATITGVGTAFTAMVQPDYATNLPAADKDQEEILAEFICNQTQVYLVAAIANDTSLSTMNTVTPALPVLSAYALATLPEIPREHIRVIAAHAMAKVYSVANDDARVSEWTAIAQNNLQMMKDSLIERQSNNPPTKQRFPYGIGRRNRAFMR